MPALFGSRSGRAAGLDAVALLVVPAPMLLAWLVKELDRTTCPAPRAGTAYLVGFGPILCAITLDAYVKEFAAGDAVWDKTEKTGRVVG